MKYDVVVIGSGMSGLVAAAKAASRNKNTLVITKGQGALPLTSGCIDLLGYRLDDPRQMAANPYEEIGKLTAVKPKHPYAKTIEYLVESMDFLREVLESSGYVLSGTVCENRRVLTALGTERVSALLPPSMHISEPDKIKAIIAVGFKNYPDFFPQMFLDNLRKSSFPEADKIPLTMDLGIKEIIKTGYLSNLLEKETVLDRLIEELRTILAEHGFAAEESLGDHLLIVFPAVLGRGPDHSVWNKLRRSLGVQVIEVPGLPPSVPGQRLYKAMMSYLRRLGAEVRFNSQVIGFTSENNRITSVTVRDSSDLAYSIRTGSVVLASGSFMGGGLVAKKESVIEPIFDLPVVIPGRTEGDSHFLSLDGQRFLWAGVETDENLRPLSDIENLYAAGSILAHTNYAAEKNGLGVAIATGYKAGCLA